MIDQLFHATIRSRNGAIRTVQLRAKDMAEAAMRAQQDGSEVLSIGLGPIPPPDASGEARPRAASDVGISVALDRRSMIVLLALVAVLLLFALAPLLRATGLGVLGGTSADGGISGSERAAQMLIEEQRRARKQADLDAFQDRLDRNADAFMRQQMLR